MGVVGHLLKVPLSLDVSDAARTRVASLKTAVIYVQFTYWQLAMALRLCWTGTMGRNVWLFGIWAEKNLWLSAWCNLPSEMLVFDNAELPRAHFFCVLVLIYETCDARDFSLSMSTRSVSRQPLYQCGVRQDGAQFWRTDSTVTSGCHVVRMWRSTITLCAYRAFLAGYLAATCDITGRAMCTAEGM